MQEKNNQLNKRIKELEDKKKNLEKQNEKNNFEKILRNQYSQLNEKIKELEDKNKGKIIILIFL